jgi:hypothetical protein
MYESMILLMAENQWDVTKYFIGMKSKLIMTVLNASLMFMFKENVLLHVSVLFTFRTMYVFC